MIRLATANDYSAVSDLLNTYPSFSARPKELTTRLISAASRVSFMFALKIAVVSDNRDHIVGCMLINEGSYFLHAEAVCVKKKLNWQLILYHMKNYIAEYARDKGYEGYALSVNDSDFAEYLNSMNATFGYIDYHRDITTLRGTTTNQVQTMSLQNIAEFAIRHKQLTEFADIESKLPIYLASHDYTKVMSDLNLYQCMSADKVDSYGNDFSKLSNFIFENGDIVKYLTNVSAEKLVILDHGRAVGFAVYKTTSRHAKSIEISDLFILPKYVNSDLPRKLVLAVGAYGASRGAHFMCGKGAMSGHSQYMRAFFNAAEMVPDEYTFVFAFDAADKTNLAEDKTELINPDISKTGVFSG